ncbi:MAG TPA: methylated-DNA--[protein]-cysteine S-methyltransferase [Candidatus Eremiobacteraceae bacterium]
MNAESLSAVFDSPVGPLFVRAEAGALVALSFVDFPIHEKTTYAGDSASRDIVRAVESQIGEYFAGSRTEFDIPMKLIGTPFNVRVWEALRAIAYGTTMAYGRLAKQIGEPDAARAVGAANGANPIVIIVPCHRVIGTNGRLVGYGGGLRRKQFLLDLESGPLLSFRSLRL